MNLFLHTGGRSLRPLILEYTSSNIRTKRWKMSGKKKHFSRRSILKEHLGGEPQQPLQPFRRNFAVANWMPTAHKRMMGEFKEEEELGTLLKSFHFLVALESLPFLFLAVVVEWVRGDVWTNSGATISGLHILSTWCIEVHPKHYLVVNDLCYFLSMNF